MRSLKRPRRRLGRALAQNFRQWINSLDDTLLLSTSELRAWCATTPVLVAILASVAYGPGGRLVGLRFAPALGVLVPNVAAALTLAVRHRGRRHLGFGDRCALALNSASLQFFCACLIVFASVRGGALISSLLLFMAAQHGQFYRAAPSQPFMAVGTALATAGAAVLAPTRDHLGILAFVGVTAVTASVLLGRFALEQDKARAEADRLRAAVHAQMLSEQDREVGRLSETLVDVLGCNHDLNNSLMSAALSAEVLVTTLETDATLPREEREELSVDLMESLAQIRQLVSHIRAIGRDRVDAGGAVEVVDVWPVADDVCQRVGARFPDRRVTLAADRAADLRAHVRGGVVTLRRVLENLLTNACEGDGERAGDRVTLALEHDAAAGRVRLTVRDNGPGFAPAQLAAPIEGFGSSKPDGTGLGLYTAERLVRASGGTLARSNADAGGAVVVVMLPQEYA